MTASSDLLTIRRIGNGQCLPLAASDLGRHDLADGEYLWLDIAATPSQELLNHLEKELGLHEIALDNLFDNLHNPRLLEFPDHLLLGARVLDRFDEETVVMSLGIVIGKRFILTAHEQPLRLVKQVTDRILANASQVQEQGPDRLLYVMLDALVDDYYERLDWLSEAIDEIDDRATIAGNHQDRDLQRDILQAKRRLLALHRAVTPLRDALLGLRHSNRDLVTDANELYLRDVFEHVLQLQDSVETYREILSSTTELLMSSASNRMNEIMTFLTVFTTFFIPLNFITSYYGMNLMMPEIRFPLTYPIVIFLLCLSLALMFIWFRRKKWL
jgi:magnesium transporter